MVVKLLPWASLHRNQWEPWDPWDQPQPWRAKKNKTLPHIMATRLRMRKNSSNKNAVSTGPQQAWENRVSSCHMTVQCSGSADSVMSDIPVIVKESYQKAGFVAFKTFQDHPDSACFRFCQADIASGWNWTESHGFSWQQNSLTLSDWMQLNPVRNRETRYESYEGLSLQKLAKSHLWANWVDDTSSSLIDLAVFQTS